MSGAKIDQKYHYLGGILVSLFFFIMFNCFFDYQLIFKGAIKELLASATTISAIGVGFLATTKAILISIRNTKIIKWLKNGGHYKTLINYSMNAIHWCFAVAIYSSLCLFFDFTSPEYGHFILIIFWMFFAATAFLASYRVIKLFSTILQKESENE